MGLYDFFSRVLVPVRQRPSSTDLNRLQTYLEQNDRWIVAGLGGSAASADVTLSPVINATSSYPAHGFLKDGFYVGQLGGPLDVQIRPGIGFLAAGPASATDIDADSGADWLLSSILGAPAVLSAGQSFTAPAVPAAGSSRIDLIEVRADYLAGSPATIGILNTVTRVFDPTVRNKRLHWDLLGRTGNVNAPSASTAPISYVRGVSAVGSISAATEPTVTSGYVAIARINLDNSGGAMVAISQDMISDLRPRIYPGGVMRASARITVPGLVGAVASPNNVIESVDLPQGMTLLAAFQNNVPPSAGISYTATCLLIDGSGTIPRTIPGSGFVGSAFGTAYSEPRICCPTVPLVVTVDAAMRAIFDGSNPIYTNLGNTTNLPIGQPCLYFTVRVRHPAGSAVSNAETFALEICVGQG